MTGVISLALRGGQIRLHIKPGGIEDEKLLGDLGRKIADFAREEALRLEGEALAGRLRVAR